MSETSDRELAEFAFKRLIPLRAIVNKDQLKDLSLEYGAYIINLANENDMGTHWVGLSVNEDGVAYFDSFGYPAPAEVESFILPLTDDYISSSLHIQNIYSGYCGQYTILFLQYLNNKNYDIRDRYGAYLNLFDSDIEKNKTILLNNF